MRIHMDGIVFLSPCDHLLFEEYHDANNDDGLGHVVTSAVTFMILLLILITGFLCLFVPSAGST
jgi:hypothetical protein